jgi:hypothetical protein
MQNSKLIFLTLVGISSGGLNLILIRKYYIKVNIFFSLLSVILSFFGGDKFLSVFGFDFS